MDEGRAQHHVIQGAKAKGVSSCPWGSVTAKVVQLDADKSRWAQEKGPKEPMSGFCQVTELPRTLVEWEVWGLGKGWALKTNTLSILAGLTCTSGVQ